MKTIRKSYKGVDGERFENGEKSNVDTKKGKLGRSTREGHPVPSLGKNYFYLP